MRFSLFLFRCLGVAAVVGCLALPARAQQATLTGTVTDASDGSALPGANVILTVSGQADIAGGTATGADGRYSVRVQPGDYVVTVRFIGYGDQSQLLTLAPGETRTLDVSLGAGAFDLNDVVVSASRAQEQVLDAPASVSVIGVQELQQTVSASSVTALRNEVGIDFSQTGVDRQEVALRGFNNAFSGSTFALVDYRIGAVPSLGVNIYGIMPNLSSDLDRIEVVRGPGSALYGPGVDAGVVHFLTKDPFGYPGTSVSVAGGERSLFSFEGRHAGVINGNLGYKITGQFARADDWQLNSADSLDALQLAGDFVYDDPSQAPDFQTVGPDGRILREDGYQKANLNGLLQYRIRPGVTLSANAGYAAYTGTVLSGIGTLQADNFGYTFGQLRLQAGRFFAQAYVNQNSAGDSYVYGTGLSVVDKGRLYVGQAQYDMDLMGSRVIGGIDLRVTRPDTEGTILGRNEDDDQIEQYGAYAQSTTPIGEKLDLTLALRGDYNNIADDIQLSPRAALVFKPASQHTLRATYNRAFNSPGTNSLFLDIPGRVTDFGNGQSFVLQARGVRDGFTFNNFRNNNSAQFYLPVPGLYGGSFPVNQLPLVGIYGAAAQLGLAQALLAGQAPALPGLGTLSAQQQQLLGQLLGYTAGNASLGLQAQTSAGYLAKPNVSDGSFDRVSGPVDVDPLKPAITSTIELGYKGIVGEKLLVAVDGYYTQKSDFVGPLTVESPLVYLDQDQLSIDTGTQLGQLFATTSDPAIRQLLAGLGQAGLSPAQVAQILGGLVGGSLATTPVAAVQPDQAVLQDGQAGAVGGFLSYRNFGEVNFYGVDVAMQYLASSSLTLFGNVSWVSDNDFTADELGEAEDSGLRVALNATQFKGKAGFSYSAPRSYSVNASGRYVEGFPVLSGPYDGEVPSYFLLDIGAGYDLSGLTPGARVDLLVQNVLDNERREFVGAPQIGRMAILRASYTF
jgi:iron complex outermembrane receptor protein